MASAPAGLGRDEDAGRLHSTKKGNFHEIFNLTENERPLAGVCAVSRDQLAGWGPAPGGGDGGLPPRMQTSWAAAGGAGGPAQARAGGPCAVNGSFPSGNPAGPAVSHVPQGWHCWQLLGTGRQCPEVQHGHHGPWPSDTEAQIPVRPPEQSPINP